MTNHPPIYVINMAQDTQRLASIAAALSAQGLAFERVDGVVGRELSDERKRLSYSPFWYGLLMGRQPSDAELGCNLSHRLVWKMMLDCGQDWAIIFEDDAKPAAEFSKNLEMFEAATRNYDLVHFFSLKQPDVDKIDLPGTPFRLMTYSGANPTATAYGLRASGARKLLKCSRIIFTNDKWVWARALLGLKCVAVFPFPVGMHAALSGQSTIGAGKRQGHIFWRISVLPILRVVRSVILKFRDV